MRLLVGLAGTALALALAACGGPAAPLEATCRVAETGALELAFGADHAEPQPDGTVLVRAGNETPVALELISADVPGSPVARLDPGTETLVGLPGGRSGISLLCVDPRPDGLVQGVRDAPEYATVRVLDGIPWAGG